MTKDEHINECLDWFDFCKVAKVMKYLDWWWAFCKTGVPEEPELRASAREYLSKVYDKALEQGSYYYIKTGGFKYSHDPEKDHMSIKFTVSERTTNEY